MIINEYISAPTPAGRCTITDLGPGDIGPITRFWHNGGADLEFMGVDTARLGTPEDTRKRFEAALPTHDPNQKNIAFAIRLHTGQTNEIIGYTLLNRYSPDTNYSHWHIIKPALRGLGISSALYPYRIQTYFSRCALTRLIHQTRTRNIAVNKMLDKYVPIVETRYIEHPDGVAMPGEFHIRYVTASDIPSFFNKIQPASQTGQSSF